VRIAVLDYEAGNLTSVKTALDHLEIDYEVISEAHSLSHFDKLIVPGVGEAKAIMAVLKKRGLDQAIHDYFETGKPILGICIGSQIVLEHSEERDTACLGLIPGRARGFLASFEKAKIDARKEGLKVPQIGWNQVFFDEENAVAQKLFNGIPQGRSFFFVHSYYPSPSNSENSLSKTEYGVEFSSAMVRDNLIVVQFHPEKSGVYGLKLLNNFVKNDW
jgi:glutamine amidotransferase